MLGVPLALAAPLARADMHDTKEAMTEESQAKRTPAAALQRLNDGIGDIFAPRIAGNFVDEEILGSLEFTARAAGSRLIVVLGHTECGAVKGACDGVKLGNLTATLAQIEPVVAAVTDVPGERSSKNPAFVSAVTHANVDLTVREIREKSEILREMEQKDEIAIVGAIYDVKTGLVSWLPQGGATPDAEAPGASVQERHRPARPLEEAPAAEEAWGEVRR